MPLLNRICMASLKPYIQEIDQVLESLSLEQLSPSEKNTLLNKAIRGSSLRTMLDDERSHIKLLVEDRRPFTYEMAHALYIRQSRRFLSAMDGQYETPFNVDLEMDHWESLSVVDAHDAKQLAIFE